MVAMLAKEKWQIATIAVLEEVFEERCRQVARYGMNEKLYDGTGPDVRWIPGDISPAGEIEAIFRVDYESFEKETGAPTWLHLVREEIAEAFMESDPVLLEGELVQVAALCTSWIERLRERGSRPLPESPNNRTEELV
jgi:hypothetical protein